MTNNEMLMGLILSLPLVEWNENTEYAAGNCVFNNNLDQVIYISLVSNNTDPLGEETSWAVLPSLID